MAFPTLEEVTPEYETEEPVAFRPRPVGRLPSLDEVVPEETVEFPKPPEPEPGFARRMISPVLQWMQRLQVPQEVPEPIPPSPPSPTDFGRGFRGAQSGVGVEELTAPVTEYRPEMVPLSPRVNERLAQVVGIPPPPILPAELPAPPRIPPPVAGQPLTEEEARLALQREGSIVVPRRTVMESITQTQPLQAAKLGATESIEGAILQAISPEGAPTRAFDDAVKALGRNPTLLEQTIRSVIPLAVSPLGLAAFILGRSPMAGRILATGFARVLGPKAAQTALTAVVESGGATATAFAAFEGVKDATEQIAQLRAGTRESLSGGETLARMGHGALMGAALGPTALVPGRALQLGAEVGVFATTPALMEGRAPTVQDVIDAGLLVGTLRVTGRMRAILSRPRVERSPEEQAAVDQMPAALQQEVVRAALEEADRRIARRTQAGIREFEEPPQVVGRPVRIPTMDELVPETTSAPAPVAIEPAPQVEAIQPVPSPPVITPPPAMATPPPGRRRATTPEPGGDLSDLSDPDTLVRFIRARGGISPETSLRGEYRGVPLYLKSKAGLTPERMAEAISEATGQPLSDADLLARLQSVNRDRLEKRDRQRTEAEAELKRQEEADLSNLPEEEKTRRIAAMLGKTEAEAQALVKPPESQEALDQAMRDFYAAFADESTDPRIFDLLPDLRDRFGTSEDVAQRYYGGDTAKLRVALEQAKTEGPMVMAEEASPYGPNNPFADRALRARERYNGLTSPTAREKAIERSFPLGTGYGRKGGERRIAATVNRAVKAEQARKDAEYYEAAAAAFDRGEINAQGRAMSESARTRSDERQAAKERRDERIRVAQEVRADRPAWEVPAAIWADSSGYLAGSGRDLVLHDHRVAVERAVGSGKQVPPEVLADYPDLKLSVPPRMTGPAEAEMEIVARPPVPSVEQSVPPVRQVPAPKTEPTPEGEQAMIPGTEGRAMPPTPLRPEATQKPVEETPLFGQERARREAEAEEAQGRLFEPPTPYGEPEPAPPFYSKLERAIEERMPERALGPQVGSLARSAGVKEDEIKWTGLDDWLRTKAGQKVTKAEVLEFLRENKVELREVMKGTFTPEHQAEVDDLNRRLTEAAQAWRDARDHISRELQTKGMSRDDAFALATSVGNDVEGAFAQANELLRRGEPRSIETEFRVMNPLNRIIDQGRLYDRLQKQLREVNAVRMTEVPKFKRYTLPGGENYRELLLTLPQRPIGALDAYTIERGAPTVGIRGGVRTRVLGPGGRIWDVPDVLAHESDAAIKQWFVEAYPSQVLEGVGGRNYRSPHFDEPNVLAHIRMTDRTDAEGKRVLFLEEIQSDWHAQGRRKGYATPGIAEAIDTMKAEASKLTGLPFEDVNLTELIRAKAPEELIQRFESYMFGSQAQADLVPRAPFAKTWHELVLKRMLRYVAEKGYDKLAWTTGEQQAERYDLSKQVSAVEWSPKFGSIRVTLPDGKQQMLPPSDVTEQNLDQYVGKDVARRLVEQSGNPLWRKVEGEDLRVGGEGLKALYDRTVPQFLNQYGKKWGARVGEAKINASKFSPQDLTAEHRDLATRPVAVPSLDITPAMRQSVLREGQPLFEREARYGRAAQRPEGFGLQPEHEQLLLDLEGTGREAVGLAARPGGVRRQPAGLRALGITVPEQLRTRGSIDFRGQRAATLDRLAVLGQVLRDPRYETGRLFYFQGDQIVGHEAFTSRLPSTAPMLPEGPLGRLSFDVLDRARRLGADGIALMHNHPSGDPKPSAQDARTTLNFLQKLQEAARQANYLKGVRRPGRPTLEIPEFKGHVIIDSGKYSVITGKRHPETGDLETYTADLPPGPDLLLTPSRPGPGLGETIKNAEDVARVGRGIALRENYVAGLFLSGQTVRAVHDVPRGVLRDPVEATNYLRGLARTFGGNYITLYDAVPDAPTMQSARTLWTRGVIRDYVQPGRFGAESEFRRGQEEGRRQADEGVFGATPRTIRVQEEPARYDIEADAERPPSLEEPKLRLPIHRRIVAAAGEVFQDLGIKRDPDRALSDQILDLMQNGQLRLDDLEPILTRHDLTVVDLGEQLFRPAVRDAARRLQVLSALSRLMGREEGSETVRGLSWWRRADHIRRGLLVTQLATAARNFETQVGRLGLDVLDQGLQRKLAQLFGHGAPTDDPVSALEPLRRVFAAPRETKRDVDAVLREFPKEWDRLLGTYSSDLLRAGRHPTGRLDKILTGGERAVETLNWANRLQEFIVRRAVFHAGLDGELRQLGERLENVLREGRPGQIPLDAIRRSVNRSLEITFALHPPEGSAGDLFIKTVNRLPVLLTGPIPFPRFMVNSLKFQYEFSPLGLLRLLSPGQRAQVAKGNMQVLSRAAIGTALLGAALAVREGQEDDQRWYEVRPPGMDRSVDIRPLNPFASYFFVAELIKRGRQGTLYHLDARDVATGILSTNVRGGTGLFLLDQLMGGLAELGTPGKWRETLKSAAGELVGGLFVPLRQLSDIWAQFSEEARIARDARQEPFLGPIKRNIPGVAETLPEAQSPTRAAPPVREAPLLRQMTGVIVTSPKNAAERELDRLQVTWREIMAPTSDAETNRLLAKHLGPLVERGLGAIVERPGYQQMSDDQKGVVLTKALSRLRATAKKGAVTELGERWAAQKLRGRLSPRERLLFKEQLERLQAVNE